MTTHPAEYRPATRGGTVPQRRATVYGHNPLHQPSPPTPEVYASLHRAAQSAAAWLLRDHKTALDEQMAAERRELAARLAAFDDLIEGRRAKATKLQVTEKELRAKIARRSAAIETLTTEFEELDNRLRELSARHAELRARARRVALRAKAIRAKLEDLGVDPDGDVPDEALLTVLPQLAAFDKPSQVKNQPRPRKPVDPAAPKRRGTPPGAVRGPYKTKNAQTPL